MKRAVAYILLGIVAGCTDGASAVAVVPPSPDAGPPPAPDASAPRPCALPAPVTVAARDLYGYPPYAGHGCVLVYLSPAGDLVAADLAAGKEETLAPASDRPRRPAVSDLLFAWEATVGGRDVVRVRARSSSAPPRTLDVLVAAREPRVSRDVVVFTAWRELVTEDTDVYLYDATADAVRPIATGPAQQRFADVSASAIAYTDFVEDPDGRFDDDAKDLADVVVVDRATGAITRRTAPGKQAFPMLASDAPGRVAYMSWGEVHPEPKLQAYELRAGLVAQPAASDASIATVTTDGLQSVRPSLAPDGTLEWVLKPVGAAAALMRAPMDGSRAASRAFVASEVGTALFAPASGTSFTAIAAQGSTDRAPALFTTAR